MRRSVTTLVSGLNIGKMVIPIDASYQNGDVCSEKRPAEEVERSPLPGNISIRITLRRQNFFSFSDCLSTTALIPPEEVNDDNSAANHVGDLASHSSDEHSTTDVHESPVVSIASSRNTGDSAANTLDDDGCEIRANKDVRIPFRFQLRVVLAAVEDDVLEDD